MMNRTNQEIATQLALAERSRIALPPLSETYPELTIEQAYAIQSAWFQMKLEEHTQLIGRKVGLTSRAMQESLGVDSPDYGFLLNTMMVPSESTLSRDAFLLPRVEPEIAFWLSKDLSRPGVTVEDVLAATQGVSPSLELVDSRIANWRIKLVDTIADNASSARVIVKQDMVSLQGLDLKAMNVVLTRNGETVGTGNGAAVLGHPAAAVAWLANKLSEFGVSLLAGQLVLPGAMCAAVPVAAGEVYRAIFTDLGEVSVRFA